MAAALLAEGDRYEFRIFRPQPGAEAALLEAMSLPGRSEIRVDRHLVTPGRTDAGPKIRGGRRVELKLLRARWRMLERWRPAGSLGFPANRRDLAPLFRRLGLPPPCPDAVVAHGAALVGRASACGGRGAVAAARKRRQNHAVGGTQAEIGVIRWHGRQLETFAIEAVDRVEVATLVARLGLAGAPSTRYPRLIAQDRSGGEAIGASG